MDSLLTNNLECAICHELFDEPKQLSCTHTFCQKCLAVLFDAHNQEHQLNCPICRQRTQVENADISKLPTNFPIKALVEDLKGAKQICTACDHETRTVAVAYCQKCGVYMCSMCLDFHSKWKRHAGHEVVDSNDIKSGKVKMKQLCKKHPQEEMEWICSTCKVPVCFRCRMLCHSGPKHKIEEVGQFQKALKDEAKVLQKEALEKLKLIEAHERLLKEEKVKIISVLDERKADVVKAFEGSAENLAKRKDELVKKLQKCKEEMVGNLENLQGYDLKTLNSIRSSCDQMTCGVEGNLEGESLVVHQRICKELKGLLARADCNNEKPREVTKRAKSIKFTRYSDQCEKKLGEIDFPWLKTKAASSDTPRPIKVFRENKHWSLMQISSLSISGAGVADMASTADGRIAVGYSKGGIDLFTVNGLQGTFLENTPVISLGVFADGRYAIHVPRSLSVYSCQFRKHASIEVANSSKKSCLCVGQTGDVFLFHSRGEWNHVSSLFRSEGEKLVRIQTKEGTPLPHHASLMNHRPLLVLGYESSIRVVSREFKCIYEVQIDNGALSVSKACPVVLADDSILIGWASVGYATVDLYTHDLRYVRTVLQNFRLHGNHFMMKAFSSGEIALCDARAVHIFGKT